MQTNHETYQEMESHHEKWLDIKGEAWAAYNMPWSSEEREDALRLYGIASERVEYYKVQLRKLRNHS
jgi:hypothetical protein